MHSPSMNERIYVVCALVPVTHRTDVDELDWHEGESMQGNLTAFKES